MVSGPPGLEETAQVPGVIVEGLERAEDLDSQGLGIRRTLFHGDKPAGLGGPAGQDVLGPLEDVSLFPGIEPAPDRVSLLSRLDGPAAEFLRGQADLAYGLESGRILGDELFGGFDTFVANDKASVHAVTQSFLPSLVPGLIRPDLPPPPAAPSFFHGRQRGR